jgi:hypothetical protein
MCITVERSVLKNIFEADAMAGELSDIHTLFLQKMHARYRLRPVELKHPFPERPSRALGLMKIDGEVYSSGAFTRCMVLKTRLATSSRCSRSIYLCPRPELYLPVFSSETILMGAKRAFLVDIHTTVRPERWTSLDVEQRLLDIRAGYGQLLERPRAMKGRINDIMSPAHLYAAVPPEADSMALAFFSQYLDVFLDLVDHAAPVSGKERQHASEDFEAYHATVIGHDPAVKLYSMLFGTAGGTERVNDLFFAR